MTPGTGLVAAADRQAPRSQATHAGDRQDGAAGQALTASWHRGDARVVDHLAEHWRQLCEEGPCDEPFFRPEWIGAHIRAFSPHRRVRLATVSAGARLRAVLPLLEERGLFCGLPARTLRSPANDHSGRFDLSYGAGDAEAAIARLWEHLKATRDWDVLSLQDVPEAGGGQRLVELARRDGWPAGTTPTIATPILPMAGVRDPVAAVQNAHFRQNVRRRIRKVSERFSVELVRFDRVDPDALDAFYTLERSGWKGHGGTAIACAPETKRFWDEVAESSARFGYFALYVLRFSGVPVAGHFGLFHGGRYYIPKVAYDERFAPFGPGHLMIEAALRDCVARGITLFDFVGASMSWKLEWTSRVRRHANCYIFRRGAYGRALHAAKFQIDTRLRSFARRPRVARLRARLSGEPS